MNEIKREVKIIVNYRKKCLVVFIDKDNGKECSPIIIYPILEKEIDEEYIELVKKFCELTYMIEY